MTQIHATCVAVEGLGVLLRGPSGGGKSDLALRLIDEGATLVADDRCDLAVEGGRLLASPPAPIAGLMEIRGLGIARLKYLEKVPVGLVIELVALQRVERIPKADSREFLGVTVPLIHLSPFEVSAPAKVRLAVRSLSEDIMVSDDGAAGDHSLR